MGELTMWTKRKLDLSGAVQTASGEAGGQPEARLSLKGKLEGEPLTLDFVGGSALMLRETDQPYPVDLQVAYGETKLTLKGTVQDPFQYAGSDLAALAVRSGSFRHLPATRHTRPADAALSDHWQAAQ